MLQTKSDLKFYIAQDIKVNLGKEKLTLYDKVKFSISYNESYRVVKLLHYLRLHEYYTNLYKKDKSIINGILLRIYTIKHHRLEFKYGIKLGVNVFGYGLYIPHIGGGIMCDCRGIGNYCKLNNGVIIGRNHTFENSPLIGDNVEICAGSKIVRKVTIGNNVIVAPNSVVINDVPDDCMVSGVPAKIVKQLN